MLKFRKVKQGLERVYNAKNMLKYYIPYDCFLDDERSVILNKNGSLQATYQIEFADLEYSMPEVEDGVMYVLNNALKKLDENFTLHFETQRKRVNKLSQKTTKLVFYIFSTFWNRTIGQSPVSVTGKALHFTKRPCTADIT